MFESAPVSFDAQAELTPLENENVLAAFRLTLTSGALSRTVSVCDLGSAMDEIQDEPGFASVWF